MPILIDIKELNKEQYSKYVPFYCLICDKTFDIPRKQVISMINKTTSAKGNFCSKDCHNKSMNEKIQIKCCQCGALVNKRPSELKRSQRGICFCNKSCAGIYNQTHKQYGYTRSKLERFLEIELLKQYPELGIRFNDRQTIGTELDIFIPSLKLAFELNGIFHYEPIFSKDKLNKTQNNDKRKILACAEQDIGLCVIDTTSMEYFKIEKAKNFLKIVLNIINESINSNI